MSQISITYIGNGIKETYQTREIRRSHRAPLVFKAEFFVGHSPAAVWSFFSDLTNWTEWSPICRGCRLNDDHGELRLGSVLEISFAVACVIMTVPCRVVEFDPPGSIAWQGQKFGIGATHRYHFVPRNNGTLLCNEETFTGVGFPLNGLIRAWYRATKLSEESLQGIGRELLRTDSKVSNRGWAVTNS